MDGQWSGAATDTRDQVDDEKTLSGPLIISLIPDENEEVED